MEFRGITILVGAGEKVFCSLVFAFTNGAEWVGTLVVLFTMQWESIMAEFCEPRLLWWRDGAKEFSF